MATQRGNPFRVEDSPDARATSVVSNAEGTSGANTIRTTLTFKSPKGKAFTRTHRFTVLISDGVDGVQAVAAPSGGVTVAVGVQVAAVVAGKILDVLTLSNGTAAIDVVEATAKTFYLHVMLANGRWLPPKALIFA